MSGQMPLTYDTSRGKKKQNIKRNIRVLMSKKKKKKKKQKQNPSKNEAKRQEIDRLRREARAV
jgi:hypothetical protein